MPADLTEINPLFYAKTQWTFGANPLDFHASVMKCDTTNTILTWVLAVLVLAGVLFALKTIMRSRELRTMQGQAIACQGNMNRLNLLLNDAAQYGRTHPDIDRVLQPFESKPVVR